MFSSAASPEKLWKQLQSQARAGRAGPQPQAWVAKVTFLPLPKCTFYFLKLPILNKAVVKPPDSSSWSFWETSKRRKLLGAKAEVGGEPGACGNEGTSGL